MIISLVLTATLALVIFYGVRLLATQPVVGGLVSVMAALGILLAWNPDLATRIANALGVGRGTDLLVYVLFILMAMLVLLIHTRFRHYDRLLTELARSVALADARLPPADGAAGPAGRAGDEG